MTKYIAYIRVSTERQGRSGLGLKAQREIILHNVSERDILCWYEEVQSGKDLHVLPVLNKAKEHAKREDAVLVLAKADRLRNTQHALNLVDEMTPERVFFCNVGRNADKFTLTLFFAFAEKERLEISIRTKAALAILKAKGIKLGPRSYKKLRKEKMKEIALKGAQAMREKALLDRNNILSYKFAITLRKKGKTYKDIADALNASGYCTMRGGKWLQGSVYNLIKRFQ